MRIAVLGSATVVGRALEVALCGHDPSVEVVAVAADPLDGDRACADALDRGTTVVDVADATAVPRGKDVRESVLASTRSALAAAAEAPAVEHFVLVSSAGLGRPAEDEHFTARLGAEALVEASPVPHTIVRTTQLFESIRRAVQGGLRGDGRLGRIVIQPIAARDVATEVAAIALHPPRKVVVALAGPDRYHLDDVVDRLRLALFHHRDAWVDPPTIGSARGATRPPGLLHGGTATLTGTRFRDWAASTAANV